MFQILLRWAMERKKAKQRVAIAKDVISQIHSEGIRACQSVYIARSKFSEQLLDRASPHVEVREVIDEVDSCPVCARGAMFVSAMRRFDNLTVGDFRSHMRNAGTYNCIVAPIAFVEDRYFDRKQICMIESAFEGMRMDSRELELTPEEFFDCIDFHRQYRLPRDRMLAIMANIVNNKGTFKP